MNSKLRSKIICIVLLAGMYTNINWSSKVWTSNFLLLSSVQNTHLIWREEYFHICKGNFCFAKAGQTFKKQSCWTDFGCNITKLKLKISNATGIEKINRLQIIQNYKQNLYFNNYCQSKECLFFSRNGMKIFMKAWNGNIYESMEWKFLSWHDMEITDIVYFFHPWWI